MKKHAEKFLENIENGKVFAEKVEDMWMVYDDKVMGYCFSFPLTDAANEAGAIERAKHEAVRWIGNHMAEEFLNEHIQCPMCTGTESKISRWMDGLEYYCTNGHHFSI